MEPIYSRTPLSRAGRFTAAAQVFGQQADSVVRYVNHGMSVHIIGRRCSGRSALLSEVTNRLKAAGRPVLRLTGVRSWREEALAAILASGDDTTESHRPNDIAHTIVNNQLIKPGAVLVCDDADELDPQSVGILATAIREHRAVAVTTSLQTTGLLENSLVAAISPAVSSRMEAADLATLQQLAVSVLDEPLEPRALAVLAVKSGGLVGLAHALLTVGRHKGRFVRMSGGTYTINGDLWTYDLTWIAERLLTGATNAERADARSLAVAGPISFTDAENLLGRRHLRRLTDAGLTHLAEIGDLRLVNVFPPLLADYLISEPNTAMTLSGKGQRRTKLDLTEVIPAQSVALIAQRSSYDSLAQVRERRAAWGASPSAETALALFLAMEQAGTPDSEIEEILTRTPLDESEATVNLLTWYVVYHTWRETDPAGAVARLDEYRASMPAYDLILQAGQTHIDFLRGMSTDDELVAKLAAADDPFLASAARCIQIERLISQGRTATAAAMLDSLGDVDERFTEPSGLLTDLNAIFSDDVRAGTESALSRISDGHQATTGAVGMAGYIALEGLIISGHLREAFTLVENLLALEPSSELGSLVQASLLNLGSLIAIWNDRPSFAQPLTKQANIRSLSGPLPGLNTAVSKAVELGASDPAEAGRQLWRIGAECFDRDFAFSGLFVLSLAVEHGPDTAGAIPLLRELVDTLESPLAQAMARYVLAIDDHDVAAIGAAAAAFAGLGANLFATKATITQALEMRRNGRRAQAAALADTEWARLKDIDLSNPALFTRLRDDIGLSSREFAILQLAATGVTYQDIASKFDISVRTIETHFQNIGKKVGLTGRDKLSQSVRTWLKPPESC